jgi:hypothetical protein
LVFFASFFVRTFLLTFFSCCGLGFFLAIVIIKNANQFFVKRPNIYKNKIATTKNYKQSVYSLEVNFVFHFCRFGRVKLMSIILLDYIDIRSQLFVLDPNPCRFCTSCLSGNQYFIHKDVLNCGFFIIDFIFCITKIIENLQVSYGTANDQIIVD